MRDILHTVGSRYLIALLNLILIFINAKVLGVDGLGTIGLILAAIGLTTVCCGIFSGNTIIYFMNRYSMRRILFPVYAWIPIGAGIACLIMNCFDIFPITYLDDIYFLSCLNAAITANARFLLGNNRIGAFNMTYILQGGGLFFILLFFYYILGLQTPSAYILSLYITYGIAFLISSGWLFLHFRNIRSHLGDSQIDLKPLIKEMWIYGLWGSADNVAENLTTRLNYFLINYFGGLANVGLLDAGTKMSECVWHINRSIGFIEYNRIAQSSDAEEQKKITIRYLKLTIVAVGFATACILFIPEWIYTDYLFSKEFAGMKVVIYGLSPGILAMACYSIISQFFIGSGHIRYGAWCSVFGFIVLLLCGLVLIPQYGILGSAITSSIAFICMACFSLFIFCRITKATLSEFILRAEDMKTIRLLFHKKKAVR